MNNQTSPGLLSRLFLALLPISALLFAGCSDDPQATNEEEVITTFTVTIIRDATPRVAGDTVILSWEDANLDAIVDAGEITTMGSLHTNEKYTATIQILNKSVYPDDAINISEEIKEEAEEHIFCFTVVSAKISISNLDEDKHGLPLGLTSTWTTTTMSTGTVTILLRHQPGVKTGDCPGVGETDASLTFNVNIDGPE